MSPRSIIFWVLAAAAAGALILTGHGPHAIGYLPYLILFACPLMHMFMHHGHGGHQRAQSPPKERS